MRFVFRYALSARNDLNSLTPAVCRRVLLKLDYFARAENPLLFAQALKGPLVEYYRFRIGDYRVIFRITKEGVFTVLFILHIGHRRDIYSV